MPRRRRPAHHPVVWIGDRPIIVLLTVCTDRRRCILANRPAFDTLLAAWRTADAWAVGRYVVMPDHVHLLCAPRHDVPLDRWVHYWKSLSARRWPAAYARPLWQRDYWDTQLRSLDSYEEKWAYLRCNRSAVGW
jgi:REP element-mobilizing transposase RayT